MSCAAQVCRVCTKACFTFAKVFYATGWGGSFWHGVLGYARQRFRACFATFRIAAGGVWVIGVLFKESLNSYKQVIPFPGSSIINEGSCPEFLGGSLSLLYEEGHLGQDLQSDVHPLLRQLRRVGLKFVGLKFSCTFFDPYSCPLLPLLLCYRGGYFLFPSPHESTPGPHTMPALAL